MILMEDPPIHDVHRALLSRVFHTPSGMLAIEPKVREFCARSLDPLVGSGGFDFIGDLGAQMPMRTIGMLLGIPESDQESFATAKAEGCGSTAKAPRSTSATRWPRRTGPSPIHRVAGRAPVRRPHDRPLERGVRGRHRHGPEASPATR
jgi:cytochrome P450